MAREGKIGYKRKTRNKLRLEKQGSDESDEDYKVAEDEDFDLSEDEYCSSLAEDSDESLGEYEEEEWVEKKVKKLGPPRGRKGSQRSNRNGVVKSRKKKVAYSEEEEGDFEDDDFPSDKQRRQNKSSHKKEEGDDIEDVCRQEDNDFGVVKRRKRSHVLRRGIYRNDQNEKPRKKNKVSYREEEEDNDNDDLNDDDDEEFTPDEVSFREEKEDDIYDDSNDDDDEEFTPDEVSLQEEKEDDVYDDSNYDDDEEFTLDEVDGLDDEEESPVPKKNKVGRLKTQKTQITKGQRRKRNAKVFNKTTKRKRQAKEQASSKKHRSVPVKESRDDNSTLWKKKKKKIFTEQGRGRRRKYSVNSDSDFASSGSSDDDFTISEEEREQVKEASRFDKRLKSNLRSSTSLKKIKEEEIVPAQRTRPGRKGKEKLVDLKIEVGKQVCGICLSEEGKRTIRGILNCCSHYFCFACIMEWSKVESRCPLCKQRFETISRTARADGGHDLRESVIAVPQRDQVYQPSEEELRGYLDPYENVLCTECHQGGDDAFMLLCDLCDSPAHTYCVGLGREVPDGNWYCDGCRPTALASSNAQPPNPTTNHGASSISSSPLASSVRESFDLNEMYVPETPLSQLAGYSLSPRHFIGDSQASSPVPGSGAFTLFDRRRIQRTIQQLLNNRSRQSDRSDGQVPVSSISLFGSQIGPQNNYLRERLPEYNTPSLYSSPRFSNIRGHEFRSQASTSMDHSFLGQSQSEFVRINSRIGGNLGHHQQLHPCSGRSNTGVDASYQYREVSHSSLKKEQVQSMVRSHLKGLSRNLELGYSTFKNIARASTHTVLAAFRLEHRSNEVYPLRTRPLFCDHVERLANRQTYIVEGQCSSCFDWYTRNVVKEILQARIDFRP
ncbi:hypothetical protein ACJIZ3_000928 [Penstemon smallii]|uniref:Uncharacterized protein n=1 Tax=Penstemon smallii TaxID=265156 RepID=A0ABD3U3E8_9LAMI